MSLQEYNTKLHEEATQRKIEYNKNPNLCAFCGKPILVKDNEKLHDVLRRKYCSRSCASKQGHKNSPRQRNTKPRDTKIKQLSDEYIIKSYNESQNLKEFTQKLGYASIDQPNIITRLKELKLDVDVIKANQHAIGDYLKEEIFKKKTWQKARVAIQGNARKIYENSDKPKTCVVCGYDKHIEVAHIRAVSDFPPEALVSEINDLDNLIALCPNHHWEYDHGELDITEYI